MELYQRYRPKTFDQVVGHTAAVKMLRTMVAKKNVPRTVLFTGPSGTGKTTLARILGEAVSADGVQAEINCGSCEPMKTIRDLEEFNGRLSITAQPLVWILDEFQSFSRAQSAQQACLKLLEDGINQYYFICTTDPTKIIPTIRNRATQINLKAVPDQLVRELIRSVMTKEKAKLREEIIVQLSEAADGSPRKALVLLEKCLAVETSREQEKIIEASLNEVKAFELARALMDTRHRFVTDIAPLLRALADDDPDGIRRVVLQWCRTMLVGEKTKPFLRARANKIIRVFQDFVANDASGHAVLAANCLEVCPL